MHQCGRGSSNKLPHPQQRIHCRRGGAGRAVGQGWLLSWEQTGPQTVSNSEGLASRCECSFFLSCVCVCVFFPEKVDSKVAFGSAEERKLFPVHSNPTRMGIEQGLRGDPQRGPGCYADDPVCAWSSGLHGNQMYISHSLACSCTP